jgi:hypothetical protein
MKPWTKSQRVVLISFILVFASVLLIRLHFNPLYISDPPPARSPRYAELADRIDPNTADWPTLAAIPQLGEKHARAIVAYRTQFLSQHRQRAAFLAPRDLLNIKGIGPATLENLRPYLIYPGDPATEPAGSP